MKISIKDMPEIIEELKNKNQEIERLTKQNKALNEMYELTKKEYIRLNNIIKEVREYVEKENIKRFCNPTIEMALSIRKDKLLEILDKGE